MDYIALKEVRERIERFVPTEKFITAPTDVSTVLSK